jgi:serine/threonine-protein kinase
MKLLEKEPSARYRTADQLGRVLLKFGTMRNELADAPPALRLTPEVANDFQTHASQPGVNTRLAEADLDIDWLSVGLGLLAVLAVGGLIPFWMWVYFAFNPPVP